MPRERKSEYTPTEERIIAILSDGQAHPVEVMKSVLTDGEYSRVETLEVQVTNLRKILNPKGRDIVRRMVDGVSCYRMMRFINVEE